MSEQTTTEYDTNLNKPLEIPVGNSTEQGEVGNIPAGTVGSGTINGVLRLGPNAVIIISDGDNDRVKIGKLN